MVRTRIAPSPTGNPHIGTMYQALFDYAFAKKHQGKFIVRIEDTDRVRFVQGAEEKLYRSLDWFGLIEDESPRKGGEVAPYKQSERLGLYQKSAKQLVEEGKAYYCDCTLERLDEMRKKMQAEKKTPMYDRHCRELEKKSGVIRLKINPKQTYTWHDGIRGEMSFATSRDEDYLIDDQVLLKSDGFPTYHLAVVVDDHAMKITHVVRGEEWIPSTAKHVILYHYFGWEKEMPLFFHTPLLRNPDKSKLSKRQGHTDVTWYREEGFLPEAILNFLGLMGWTNPEEKEIFSLDEFIQLFDLKDIRAVGPIFDLTKLTWMNGMYIREMSVDQLGKRVKKYNAEFRIGGKALDTIEEEKFLKIIELAKSRIDTLKEFYPLVQHFLPESKFHITSGSDREVSKSLRSEFQKIQSWNKDAILEAVRVVLKNHSIRMPVLYTIVTGQERGLPLPESLEILGKESVLSRLDNVLA
ncbi:MAG TPA: glutamate--tRNA ligase [Candidatus Acidoferrales bacterium]|nr:glutamate--tRNA ligase [Candidatus Acidoferrales bacterium]